MNTLMADVGGTNTRCSLARPDGPAGDACSFVNAQFSGLAALLAHYISSLPGAQRPSAAVLAVAAPVRGDDIHMINLGWRFSRRQLQQQLGLDHLHLLNDFEALAWALPALPDTQLLKLGGGEALAHAPRVVLGPGTGLGVASLVQVAGRWQALAGEGGHVTLAAQDEQEEELLRLARRQFGHCSAERLLSGAGMSFMHSALHGGTMLPPETLGERLVQGDAAALETLGLFFRLLGTVAGNAALTLGAFGGVYIGGGIVPRYARAFMSSGFRERFEAKGRFRSYLGEIPTWLITAPYPALAGAAEFVRQRPVTASSP